MRREKVTEEQRQRIHRIIDALIDSGGFLAELEVDPYKLKAGSKMERVIGYDITVTTSGYITHEQFGQVFAK